MSSEGLHSDEVGGDYHGRGVVRAVVVGRDAFSCAVYGGERREEGGGGGRRGEGGGGRKEGSLTTTSKPTQIDVNFSIMLQS